MESIDFSKRPEAAFKERNAKKGSRVRRCKTTGGAVVVHVDKEDDDVFMDVEKQEFTPAKSRASKTPSPVKQSNKKKEEHEELGENLGQESDEFAEPTSEPFRRKRGRPKKQSEAEPSTNADPKSEENNQADKSPALRQPKKRGRKRKVILAEGANEGEEAAAEDVDKSEETHERLAAAVESVEDDASHKENSCTLAPDKEVLHSPANKTNIDPASTPIQAEEAQKTTTACSPTKPTKELKNPAKHSPLSNSKVRYRIGLSKRARIEPLLRVLRKDN